MKTLTGVLAALALSFGVPAAAWAQGLGIGPRFSFVRGNVATGTPSTRLVGGTMRIVTGGHTAIEGSFDYRAFYNETKTERTRETPLQGSLLLFLVRSTLAPYVLGGIGSYAQIHDTLGPSGVILTSTTERRIGWHLGAGAEIKFHRHAAFFADYRFRFVRFGEPQPGADPIDIPGTTVLPILDKVKLSHEGSMWTSGMAFYF